MIQLEENRFRQMLALNNANTPDVGELDEDSLRILLDMTAFLKFAEHRGELVGFIQGLLPGKPYTSLNYQWFSERYENFLYIDRAAVHPDHRRQGLGREFYGLAFDFCRQLAIDQVVLEVNIEPPNSGSHLFHQRLGFEVDGDFRLGPDKVVRMYRREVS